LSPRWGKPGNTWMSRNKRRLLPSLRNQMSDSQPQKTHHLIGS